MKKIIIVFTALVFMTSCVMIDPRLTGKRVVVESEEYYDDYYESPYYDYRQDAYAWFPFGMSMWLSPFYWGFTWGPWYYPYYWSNYYYSPYGWGSWHYPYSYYYPGGRYGNYGGSRITKDMIRKGTVKSGTRRSISRGGSSSGSSSSSRSGSSGSRGSVSSGGSSGKASSGGSGTRVKK